MASSRLELRIDQADKQLIERVAIIDMTERFWGESCQNSKS